MSDIKVCVGGRTYETTKELLMKIPYFSDMFIDCNQDGDTVIVKRSPLIFDHVLSYVIDPLYPFPSEYRDELDFFQIVYKSDALVPSNTMIFNSIMKLQEDITKLSKEFTEESLINHKFQIQTFNQLQNMKFWSKLRVYTCVKCKTTQCLKGKIVCQSVYGKCASLCLANGCETTVNDYNYCNLHLKDATYCTLKGCYNIRIGDLSVFHDIGIDLNVHKEDYYCHLHRNKIV